MKANDVEYLTDDALSFGDYAGAGTLGMANVAYLEAQEKEGWFVVETCNEDEYDAGFEPDVIIYFGDYGYQCAYVHPKHKELVDKLEDYPLLDEDGLSMLEFELLTKEWEENVKTALEKVREAIPEIRSRVRSMRKFTQLFQAFAESSGCLSIDGNYGYLSIDRLIKEIQERIDDLPPLVKEIAFANKDGLFSVFGENYWKRFS